MSLKRIGLWVVMLTVALICGTAWAEDKTAVNSGAPMLSGSNTAKQAAQFDLATCKDNTAIDAFLRKASPLYSAMARIVEFQGGYEIADKKDIPGGEWNAAERKICVNSLLTGPHRVSLVAFEMTNAYQQRLHAEIDMAVVSREITTKTEFALRHELVEYDGLRLHREVLVEIEKDLGKVPPGFFFMAGNPKPDSAAKYQLPLVMDFLKDMKALGHTASYDKCFEMQKTCQPR